MKTYKVTATCNPYNSRKHYRGEEVIKYDGATPVEWIMETNLTLEEAFDVLDRYSFHLGDDYNWENDGSIEELKSAMIKDEVVGNEDEANEAVAWYKGEGVYIDRSLVYKRGDMELEDDVVLYRIEEVE